MKVPLLKLLLSSLLILTLPPALQGRPAVQGSGEIPPASSTAEFPPQEETIWRLRQTGLAAKRLSFLLAHAPDSLETAKALLAASRFPEVAPIGVQLVIDSPSESLVEALWELGPNAFRHAPEDPQQRSKLRARLELARNRLPLLPRAVAAEAALRLMFAEQALNRAPLSVSVTSLESFITEYAGTHAALEAEVELWLASSNRPARLEALNRLAAAHPGTEAAARALYCRASDLAHNMWTSGEDPTDRFMQVLENARDLESGRYPHCYWTDEVESPVIGLNSFQPKYREGSIDRLLEALRDFARSHLVLHEINPLHYGVGYVIGSKMGELFRLKGEGPAGIEKTLIELEKGGSDPFAARYLRALWYAEQDRSERRSSDRLIGLQKAKTTLAEIHVQARGLYQRKALATLACLYYIHQDYPKARECFANYARSYPRSAYAWVATVRAGRCEEKMGLLRAALESYQTVASTYSSEAMAPVFGSAYSAEAHEALGQFDLARRAYEKAIREWDKDQGNVLSLRLPETRPVDFDEPTKDDTEIRMEELIDRAARLKRTIGAPGGKLLERGRWLLGRKRYQEAATVLEQLVTKYPESRNVREAFSVMHQARLEQALDLADVANPKRNNAEAMKVLEALAAARPFDFWVGAAKITKACLLLSQGNPGSAETIMLDALEDVHAWQPSLRAAGPLTDLEKEVAEIRRTIFRPMGADYYGEGAVDSGAFLSAVPRFFLVSSTVSVVLPDGVTQRVSIHQTYPHFDNVIVLDPEQLEFFGNMIRKLGGNSRRQPTGVMETPNQPGGSSMDILNLLNRFFPARPGHWSGWEFESYPSISRIRFTNRGFTRALASVRVGYSGGDLVLENTDGQWVAKELINGWIT